MRRLRSRQGVAGLTEVLVIMVIFTIIVTLGVPAYRKMVERSRFKQAIAQVYNIKKSMEVYHLICKGYPMVPQRSKLLDVVNYDDSGQIPIIYPKEVACDTSSLEGVMGVELYDKTDACKLKPCEYDDEACIKSSSGLRGYHGSFVIAPQNNPVSPLCSTDFGWGYALVTKANKFEEPVAVYCGATRYLSGYVIIVVDSQGGSGGTQDPDGPIGSELPESCDCGAWCFESITGTMGCCNGCDAPPGGAPSFKHTVNY